MIFSLNLILLDESCALSYHLHPAFKCTTKKLLPLGFLDNQVDPSLSFEAALYDFIQRLVSSMKFDHARQHYVYTYPSFGLMAYFHFMQEFCHRS